MTVLLEYLDIDFYNAQLLRPRVLAMPLKGTEIIHSSEPQKAYANGELSIMVKNSGCI